MGIELGEDRSKSPKKLDVPEQLRCKKCHRVILEDVYFIQFSREGGGPWCVLCGPRIVAPGMCMIDRAELAKPWDGEVKPRKKAGPIIIESR